MAAFVRGHDGHGAEQPCAYGDGIGTAGGAPKRARSPKGVPNWVQSEGASQYPQRCTMVRARAHYFRQVTSRRDGGDKTVVPHNHNRTWPKNEGCKLDAEIRSIFRQFASSGATSRSPIWKHSTHPAIHSVGVAATGARCQQPWRLASKAGARVMEHRPRCGCA